MDIDVNLFNLTLIRNLTILWEDFTPRNGRTIATVSVKQQVIAKYKGNNKITELRTILQRESQNS